MVLPLCGAVFLRDPVVCVIHVVQMLVRDSDIENWQFITGIQIHLEVMFGVALSR